MSNKKNRSIFGTVLTLAAFWATAGGAALFTAAGAFWAGTAVAYGAWSARKAAKEMRAGLSTNMTGTDGGADRMTMIRGGTSPKMFVYGKTWVSGNIVYWRPAQSKADPYAWLVLALPVAHEIDGFEGVWFGEQPLFPLDANGLPPSGPFNKTYENTYTLSGVTSTGAVPLEVHGFDVNEAWEVIPGSITCSLTKRGWDRVANDEGTYQATTEVIPDVAVTIQAGGRSVLILAAPGYEYVLTYRYRFAKQYIKVWTYNGDPNQQANADLIAASTADRPWTTEHRLRGIPYIIIRMRPDRDVFPREVENITAAIRGKNDILDTRTGASGYTDNPVLCARDYAIARCGVLAGQVNLPLLNAHANICDEVITEPSVTVPGATVSNRRFTVSIQLSTEKVPKDNLGDILSACDGSAVWGGPSFDIRAGAFETPVVFLDDSDLAGPPTVSKGPARMDLVNAVFATYRNAAKPFWPVEEAPGYISAAYVYDDGRLRPIELQMPGVVNVYQVQRLILQTLFKERNGLRVRVQATIKAVEITAEMTIGLTINVFGFVVKTFRVKAVTPLAIDLYELELQEDGALAYQWDYREVRGIDPTPNSTLPSIRNVPDIVGLALVTNESAAVFGPDSDLQAMCHVSWNAVTDPLVLSGGWIQVRHKRSVDVGWVESAKLLPTTTEYRFPIRRGDMLLVSVRCGNAFVSGRWTEEKKLADDTPTPPVTGNWIHNAQFGFPDQYAQPPWPEPIPFEGWTFQTTSNKGQTIRTIPFYALAGLPGAGFEPSNPQTILMTPNGIVIPDEWMGGWTARLPCPDPGSRVCAMVEHWNNGYDGGGWGYIETIFFDEDDVLIVGWLSRGQEAVRYGDGEVPPEALRPIVSFSTVPEGAATMRLVLWHWRKEAGGGGTSMAVWRHPYLGPASEGQIQAPKWTK